MTLRNLDLWVRGMRDGMAGFKKPQAAEVGRPSASGAGPRRPWTRTRTGFPPRDFKNENPHCPTRPIANHRSDLRVYFRTIVGHL